MGEGRVATAFAAAFAGLAGGGLGGSGRAAGRGVRVARRRAGLWGRAGFCGAHRPCRHKGDRSEDEQAGTTPNPHDVGHSRGHCPRNRAGILSGLFGLCLATPSLRPQDRRVEPVQRIAPPRFSTNIRELPLYKVFDAKIGVVFWRHLTY